MESNKGDLLLQVLKDFLAEHVEGPVNQADRNLMKFWVDQAVEHHNRSLSPGWRANWAWIEPYLGKQVRLTQTIYNFEDSWPSPFIKRGTEFLVEMVNNYPYVREIGYINFEEGDLELCGQQKN